MAKFETLIFVPEGCLLDEKQAEKNALKLTLKDIGSDFGPAERIKYTHFQEQIKLLGLDERIKLILQNFCQDSLPLPEVQQIFYKKLQLQKQLIKDAIPFLDQVQNRVKMILLSKENKSIITKRLEGSKLLNYFSASYFKEDFEKKLPDKQTLTKIIEKQNLDPDTCLVIGTDLSEEIQGAENAKLQSLLIAPKNVKIPIQPRPTLHLNKLSDLLFYLELS